MWTDDDVSLARGIGSALLAGLTLFTYLVLRLIEARQAHFVRRQEELGIDMENLDEKNHIHVEKEDVINFQDIEDAFFQMEKTKRPVFNLRTNLRIAVQALATVAFSCHTSAILPIALIGIIFSSWILFFCIWRKQFKYPWMSDMAAHHLRGSLFFVICGTTTAVTMIVATWEVDVELLDGYHEVMRIIGSFSVTLALLLFVTWVGKRYYAQQRRRQDLNTELL